MKLCHVSKRGKIQVLGIPCVAGTITVVKVVLVNSYGNIFVLIEWASGALLAYWWLVTFSLVIPQRFLPGHMAYTHHTFLSVPRIRSAIPNLLDMATYGQKKRVFELKEF